MIPPKGAFKTTVKGCGLSSAQAAIQATGWPAGVTETRFIE
jgi:hypothetical protein